MNTNTNYLIEQLEKKDRNLKILFMSHNAYWSYLQGIDMRYENCSTDVIGRGTAYIGLCNVDLKDYDLIIYYSSTFYEEDELEEIKKIATQISSNANKRVTIGYSYIIPMEERKDEQVTDEIKIVSIKKSNKHEENIETFVYFNNVDLINITLIKHDELEPVNL